MAVQRSVNWISQQRVDLPDLRSLESASRNDFDQLIQAFVTNTTSGYFVRGFNILMSGAIGGAASGLQLNVDPGALLHIASSQSGTILMVPTGTAPQQLNAATNTIVDGAFAPSALNYVSVEYERFIDDTTSAQVYIWNPTTNNETTKNAPRAQILRYRIKITTATPLSNYLPVATILTDAGNNVISITDDRPLIGRLGRGGINPNPFYVYPWPQGRTENPTTSSSNSIDPFSGGDKAIDCLKSWMDAVMSALQEIKGTNYWYSANSGGSIASLREDLGNTVITGRGFIAHSATTAGLMNWNQDINVRVIGSELTYTLLANASSTDVTLSDNEVAYITLIRDVQVTPNLIFTNGSKIVTSVGSISWTSLLQPNDWVKLASDTHAGYYQIQTVDSSSQVTLYNNFLETSTGPVGAIAVYTFGSYQASPTPSTSRDIFLVDRGSVPQGQNIFWLFLRSDNSGAIPRVYVRFLGGEIEQGESEDISDLQSRETLQYIGAPLESSSQPMYVSALNPGSVPQITQFTTGSAATMASNQYFYVDSAGNYRQYYIWVNKDGTGVDPAPNVNDIGIQWVISTGMTSAQTAAALVTALNSTIAGDFNASNLANVVTSTNSQPGATVSPSNFNVGAPFSFVVTQTGTGVANAIIKEGDSLTLAIKKLDQAIGELVNSANYDEFVNIVSSGGSPPATINGPVAPSTSIQLPLNSREGNVQQYYVVNSGKLEIYLNGQKWYVGVQYSEVGTPGSNSFHIQNLITLDVGDELEFTFGGGGGSVGGPPGPQGPVGPAGPPGSNAAGGPIAISTKTSNYTVTLFDCFLKADCTTGPLTFTLPTAASSTGRIFYLKKIDSTSNAMIIQANGSELIDGLNMQMTVVQWEEFSIISDGTTWSIF